jgi:phenylalanyl-tRNA synthetase beta chain
MLNLTLVLPASPLPREVAADALPVEILAPSLCTRYTCQVIRGIRIEKSRPWMASRLMAAGLRPINNVVDITNFVMLEWGQPLHAFDLERVRQKIVVRRFAPGETLRLLDGRSIDESGEYDPLAIADAHAPMALAGIMGGEMSGISEATADVLLEAAHFEPTGIRLSSRRLGVSSDSSYRFERGTDPNETLEGARDRATALFFSEAAAQSAGPVTDAYPTPAARAVFSLSPERVSSYLGISVTREQVISSLTKLGCHCSDDLARIEVPTRRVDVNDAVVLIEDVARVLGYEAITPSASAETPTAGSTTALDRARQMARAALTGSGYLEIRGVPLEPLDGEARFSQLQGASVTLANPLNADLARLRRSLVPFLVKTAIYNASRRAVNFRYFEIDKVFSRPAKDPEERWALGILVGGQLNDADWSTRRECDFFDLKGTVESILDSLHAPRASFVPVALEGYAAGTAARIVANGETIGAMGQVAPELLAAERIYQPVFAAEMFVEPLVAGSRVSATFEALPRFPAVFRDLSFLANRDVPYAALEQAIRAAAGPQLESLECIDVFAGKGIDPARRSIAVSMVFRAADRTLSSEEVNAAVDQIIERLGKDFSAELRSR